MRGELLFVLSIHLIAAVMLEWLCGICETRALTVVNTSVARALRGSSGSIASHFALPTIHVMAKAMPSMVPSITMTLRGGNDFLVGTSAASSTFTVGISFASCTFANSYCWV